MLTLHSSCGPSTLYFAHFMKPHYPMLFIEYIYSSFPIIQPVIFDWGGYTFAMVTSYVQVWPKNTAFWPNGYLLLFAKDLCNHKMKIMHQFFFKMLCKLGVVANVRCQWLNVLLFSNGSSFAVPEKWEPGNEKRRRQTGKFGIRSS